MVPKATKTRRRKAANAAKASALEEVLDDAARVLGTATRRKRTPSRAPPPSPKLQLQLQPTTRMRNYELLACACRSAASAVEVESAAFRHADDSIMQYNRGVSVMLMRGVARGARAAAAQRRIISENRHDVLRDVALSVDAITPHVKDLMFGDHTGDAHVHASCPKCGGEVREFSAQLRRGDEDPNTVYACQATGCDYLRVV